MTDAAITECDRIEQQLIDKLTALYISVYNAILERFAYVFQKIADIDSGKAKPPFRVRNDPDAFDAWRKNYIMRLARDENLEEIAGDMLANVGPVAVMYLRKALRKIYAANWKQMQEYVKDDISIPDISEKDIEDAVSAAEDEFTQIAYANLSNPEITKKRFKTELLLIALLALGASESRKRMRKVVNRSLWQIVTITATQRTTVQSTARQAAAETAGSMGVALGFRWMTVGDERVRHTHEAMNGQVRYGNAPFNSPSGAELRYPGDPRAPAGERINCRCWIQPQ